MIFLVDFFNKINFVDKIPIKWLLIFYHVVFYSTIFKMALAIAFLCENAVEAI
jgi:hypothetical protein